MQGFINIPYNNYVVGIIFKHRIHKINKRLFSLFLADIIIYVNYYVDLTSDSSPEH